MKQFVIYFFMLCFSCCIHAQHAVDAYFSAMPQTVLSLLDKTARLDMLDLYNSQLPAKAENIYGGQSELLKKTNDYMCIRCTDASVWQMKLLPVAHDTLIVCVHSVRAINTTSKITYYRHDWHVLKRDLPMPTFNMFIKSEGKNMSSEVQSLLDALRGMPLQVSLSETEPVLKYSLNVGSLSSDQQKKLSAHLQSVSYRWTSGKWILTSNEK